ncbi:MAG: SpoIVB peptidase [Ruminococcaceae bacterium]|nr:SpoIVB peptidase [Oscillospiraceae bacterium]
MYETHRSIQRSAAFVLAVLASLALCCPWAWADAGQRQVIPLGKAVGIKLFADGVLVVDSSQLSAGGGRSSPAQACGLKEGDILLQAGGEKIRSTEHLQQLLQQNGAAALELTVQRGSSTLHKTVHPVLCDDGTYRLGAWIRDSMAGIGTITYYDPATGVYGALGHGITDVDTARLMPLASGSILETEVLAVKKGQRGDPGQLRGDFSQQRDVGTVTVNSSSGIFGRMEDPDFVPTGQALPVAEEDQVVCGKATILSTVSGSETREYEVEIVSQYPDSRDGRDLLLQVTDQRLLDATGGIVQGMSGSPIIQDGKLVGAVTHVLVNDPTRGYGIFLENMMEAAG